MFASSSSESKEDDRGAPRRGRYGDGLAAMVMVRGGGGGRHGTSQSNDKKRN